MWTDLYTKSNFRYLKTNNWKVHTSAQIHSNQCGYVLWHEIFNRHHNSSVFSSRSYSFFSTHHSCAMQQRRRPLHMARLTSRRRACPILAFHRRRQAQRADGIDWRLVSRRVNPALAVKWMRERSIRRPFSLRSLSSPKLEEKRLIKSWEEESESGKSANKPRNEDKELN